MPYYEEDGITIYHGDCREILPRIWHHADFLISDPPYGMKYESGWKTGQYVEGDSSTVVRDSVLEIWSGNPALVFGHWSCKRPVGIRQILIWNKGDWPGMGDLSLPWGPSWEEIYVIGRGFLGTRRGSILHFPRVPTCPPQYHPTEKPVSLMHSLVDCTQGTVIDPFMGSGSTIVAAKELGRPAIGIEIEERYCEIAANRLRQGVLPLYAGEVGAAHLSLT